MRWAVQYATGFPRAGGRAAGAFTFDGASHEYLVDRYNWTWLNERAVEVPIARTAVERAGSGRVLEVGHVLGHYGTAGHTVVDRYEQSAGVINRDILEFEDSDGFDLIVSISTFEHVGWDETPRDPDAAQRVFVHLYGLLAAGGELFFTVPVGYNPELDARLRDGRIAGAKLRALRRDARRNLWREVPPGEVWDARYDHLLCTAHGIVVCSARRPA
jgi:SAM-dependent methyltransferase